ncbi:MAG: tyrosine-protein phosphatase [Clostridia bacterium]|nr:tyrosine-protein phosphatase [Clostridia bacterium]
MKKVLVFILCFAMVFSICGCGKQTNSSSKEDITAEQTDNIDAVEVDICEETVRNYLNAATVEEQFSLLNEFSGVSYDYQTLELDWNYDGSTEFILWLSEKSDFSNAIKSVVTTMYVETTTLVPGKTYYWKVTGDLTDDTLGSGKIKVKDAPVRWIKIDGSGNVRDMGGWITESGKTVKYEMMYRGKALDNITDAGKATVKLLGLKTEIDVRGSWNKPNPPQIGLNYVFIDTAAQYDYIFKPECEEEVKKNYKEIFKLLSDKSNYPIYTHCSAGADRTGTFAFITNGLLGVSYEDLTRDFELTSFSNSGKRWRGNGDGNTFGPNDLEMKVEGNYVAWGAMYKEMMDNYDTGDGKLSSAIENYLISYIGVPKSQIDSFKKIMLK